MVSASIAVPAACLACCCCVASPVSAFSSTEPTRNSHPALHMSSHHVPLSPPSTSSTQLSMAYGPPPEDLYGAIHRKEYQMKKVNAQHARPSDPVKMALGYAVEGIGGREMKLAKALRRVYEDPENPANPNARPKTPEEEERAAKLLDIGMADATMRRGSFVVDIKRRSLSRPGEQFARFDDAGMVADAMVSLGADAVFVNVDYEAYGGDLSELKSAIRAVKEASPTAAVVMKDIVVDEIQLGLAKEAGADGILLIASVLGPALENFLDQATCMGLETIVECHTANEVEAALAALAQNIMVSNYDRVRGVYHPDQAYKLAGLFPGSGGPIITLAGGDIATTDQMKKLLAIGYDGVVVGKAVMGSTRAPEFIKCARDRTLLPAEFSQWGLDDYEFDPDGNLMDGPKKDVTSAGDEGTFE